MNHLHVITNIFFQEHITFLLRIGLWINRNYWRLKYFKIVTTCMNFAVSLVSVLHRFSLLLVAIVLKCIYCINSWLSKILNLISIFAKYIRRFFLTDQKYAASAIIEEIEKEIEGKLNYFYFRIYTNDVRCFVMLSSSSWKNFTHKM